MPDTNVVTEHPPTVAGVIGGAIAATAGLITGLTSGEFNVYDPWIIGAGLIIGGICGKVSEKWTTRHFPG